MGLDISSKIKRKNFPLEIFGPNIADSMQFVASQYNIPLDYMGTVGLFTIASLSGGMYIGNSNGGIRTMLYTMLVGPSGVGKTPAYRLLCSNIVKEQFKKAFDEYRRLLDEWKIADKAASKSGAEHKTPKPILAVRMMTDGTPEGMIKKMDRSPCGFGVYYDEASKIYNLTKYRSGGNGATDFWNEIWNGDPYHDVKADDDREMYVHNPCVSLCVGCQPEKLDKIITEDSIKTGLSSRMLFCESDYIELNEDVNPFGPKVAMCSEWQEIVSSLHNKGLTNFFKDDKPYIVNFDSGAMKLYTQITQDLLRSSNKLIKSSMKEDISRVMVSYNSKLSQYFSRFCLILAIMEDHTGPVIRTKHVENALLVYQYYFATAQSILSKAFAQISTDMNESERKLFEALPDEFTNEAASAAAEGLGLSKNYFSVAKTRGLKNKIKMIGRGNYIKL